MSRIELDNVSKRYGSVQALQEVSFSCPVGQVTAFCGPNGAGKSTALRVLTGIIRADGGSARVDGVPIQELREPARQVGVLLDASAFHPGRTVVETLRLSAFAIGLPRGRAEACMDLVGLAVAARRRVGKLSLGMRQRLGIAHALLGEPSVLVLDEPSNGLDPGGIRWLDELLRGFANAGGSVLVSTHHLAAVEHTADRLVVISRGRIVAETNVRDIARPVLTVVSATDQEALLRALAESSIPHQSQADGCTVSADPASVGTLALDRGLVLTRLAPVPARLDDYLAELTDSEFTGRAA